MSNADHQPALTDFDGSETIACGNLKNSAIETINERDRIQMLIRSEVEQAFEDKFNKAKKETVSAILMGIETERLATKKKVRCQKRNSRVVYIVDDIWTIFERFQENPDEPLKETLKKVPRAAQKHHQEVLQKTKNLG